jgi:hypothetical protein
MSKVFKWEDIAHMDTIDFSHVILSAKPTNYFTNDSVKPMTQASTGYNACLHFF